MLPALEGYDWGEAFGYAGESDTCATSIQGGARVNPVPDASCHAELFTREDVIELIGVSDGENDERDWVCAGRIKDGRWFCLRAGCDYTGWDCQAGGNASVADDRESLIRLGMSDEERARLGVEVSP